jgi:hypothetical protein
MNTILPVKQFCIAGGTALLLLSSAQTWSGSDTGQSAEITKTNDCILGGSGVVMHLDPKTGRPTSVPAAEQSHAMAALLAAQANRSTTGLVQEQGPTGGVIVNLRNRFRSPLVAVVNQDGSVTTDHLNCGRSAADDRQGG